MIVNIDVVDVQFAIADLKKAGLRAKQGSGGLRNGAVELDITVRNSRDKKNLSKWLKKNEYDLDDYPELKEGLASAAEERLRELSGLNELFGRKKAGGDSRDIKKNLNSVVDTLDTIRGVSPNNKNLLKNALAQVWPDLKARDKEVVIKFLTQVADELVMGEE